VLLLLSIILFEQDHRGMLGAGFQLSVTIGVSSVYALGLTLDWNWLAVVALIIATVGTVLLTVVPESPRWLVSHSRAEEAVKAVRWLTGFSDEDIERELTEIEETLLTQVINQSINQTVYNVLFSMLARVGLFDAQQLLHLVETSNLQ